MAIEPVVSQSILVRTQDVKTELDTERFVQQGAYKNEMEKDAQKQFTEVQESSELEKLVDENAKKHNSNGGKKKKREKEKSKDTKKDNKYEEELKKKATNRGNLFDFKA